MKVFLINLAKDTERLAVADAQLKRLGVDYERFDAVYAKALSNEKLDGGVNHFRWWCAVGRPVRAGEIGCAMSHYAIYTQIEDYACVLEDDVILDDRFSEVLNFVEKNIDCSKPQVFLLSDHTPFTSNAVNNDTPRICRCPEDMYTEGYVITRKAADALSKANWPMQCPCDWWGRWARHGIIELYHAYPTVCRQDQTQYASATVDGDTFRVSELPVHKWCWHKAKRLIGKTMDYLLK